MARALTTNQRLLFSAPGVKKFELIQIDFSTGAMRLTTAGRNVTYGGHTWLGDGTLLSVGDVDESIDLQASDWQFELAGTDTSLVSLALLGLGKGRRVRMWVAALNSSGAIEGDPVVVIDTHIDTMPVMDRND